MSVKNEINIFYKVFILCYLYFLLLMYIVIIIIIIILFKEGNSVQ